MTLDIFVDKRLYRAESTILALNSALGSNRAFLQGSLSSAPYQPPFPSATAAQTCTGYYIYHNLRHASPLSIISYFEGRKRTEKRQVVA